MPCDRTHKLLRLILQFIDWEVTAWCGAVLIIMTGGSFHDTL
jgi:hypothetical protein